MGWNGIGICQAVVVSPFGQLKTDLVELKYVYSATINLERATATGFVLTYNPDRPSSSANP